MNKNVNTIRHKFIAICLCKTVPSAHSTEKLVWHKDCNYVSDKLKEWRK